MASTINLNGKAYPFAKTSEGAKLLKQLHVNEAAVKQGYNGEIMKYAYCMAAGASFADKKEFPFTLEQFAKASPKDWKKLAVDLYQAPEETPAPKSKK